MLALTLVTDSVVLNTEGEPHVEEQPMFLLTLFPANAVRNLTRTSVSRQ